MLPNPGSPRAATNRKAPGQRPAGRPGVGGVEAQARPLRPPIPRAARRGHLYSGQRGRPRRKPSLSRHVRFGQGRRRSSWFPPPEFRPWAAQARALRGTARWAGEPQPVCLGYCPGAEPGMFLTLQPDPSFSALLCPGPGRPGAPLPVHPARALQLRSFFLEEYLQTGDRER
ncbi:unnamed protein product [Rangifer tarandus platyrhynchus]|uniref:Uncharacterized protein n=1 Tax=Rangifer tarandus platyrhynchus TaxID=3082113 RepID=A0AC59Z671_RANTA